MKTWRRGSSTYNTTYLRLYDAFLRLYEGQYPIMGNAQVMTAKVAWDNACYWGMTALLYFQRKYRQPEFIASIEDLMRRFFVLHARMQQFLRAWNDIDARSYGAGFTSVVTPDWLRQLQGELGGPLLADDALRARLQANFALLERFARALQAVARAEHGERQELRRILLSEGQDGSLRDLDIKPLRVAPAGSRVAL